MFGGSYPTLPLDSPTDGAPVPYLNKEMILKSLKRDQDKLLNPRTEPFSSVVNAYDSLLPYHIFLSPTYDDMIYQSVKRPAESNDMTGVLDNLATILFSQDNSLDELQVMEERLKVEEERYYLSKTINYRNTKIKDIERQFFGK